ELELDLHGAVRAALEVLLLERGRLDRMQVVGAQRVAEVLLEQAPRDVSLERAAVAPLDHLARDLPGAEAGDARALLQVRHLVTDRAVAPRAGAASPPLRVRGARRLTCDAHGVQHPPSGGGKNPGDLGGAAPG